MCIIKSCQAYLFFFFFFNDTATTEIYTLSLHDALPISQAPELSVSTADICADNLPAADGPRLGCVTMTNYSDSAFMPWVVAVITIVSIIALISIIAYVIYRRRRKRRDHADSSMHLHPLSE